MSRSSPKNLISSNETACCEAAVAVFPNAYVEVPKNRRLGDVLEEIRAGKFKKQIGEIRAEYNKVLAETGDPGKAKKAILELKKQLPAFCVSGTATNRTQPLTHSGLLQIDLDDLGEHLSAVREKMKADKHCAFLFASPSGAGVKLGFRIDGTRHKESFNAIQHYFKSFYGLAIDVRCKDVLRLCFVSCDLDLQINADAVVFEIPEQTDKSFVQNEGELQDIRLHSTSCMATSLHLCIPTSLHNKTDAILANIQAREDAMKSLAAKHPNLLKLYSQMIEPRYQAKASCRNDFITEAVPFLYRAVAAHFILELVGCFYDCNRALFNDPREQHLEEGRKMLNYVTATYASLLTEGERRIYAALEEREQDAFRICRDLALRPGQNREPLTFYMSFEHLGMRSGVFPPQAQRVMWRLEGYGLLKLLEKGTRRAVGVAGKAGHYRWLLSP